MTDEWKPLVVLLLVGVLIFGLPVILTWQLWGRRSSRTIAAVRGAAIGVPITAATFTLWAIGEEIAKGLYFLLFYESSSAGELASALFDFLVHEAPPVLMQWSALFALGTGAALGGAVGLLISRSTFQRSPGTA